MARCGDGFSHCQSVEHVVGVVSPRCYQRHKGKQQGKCHFNGRGHENFEKPQGTLLLLFDPFTSLLLVPDIVSFPPLCCASLLLLPLVERRNTTWTKHWCWCNGIILPKVNCICTRKENITTWSFNTTWIWVTTAPFYPPGANTVQPLLLALLPLLCHIYWIHH